MRSSASPSFRDQANWMDIGSCRLKCLGYLIRLLSEPAPRKGRCWMAVTSARFMAVSISGEITCLSNKFRWVRSPSRSPFCSGIVQLVEHQTLNLSVGGSNPSSGSNNWGSALERQQQGLQNLRMSVRIRSSPPCLVSSTE